MDQVDIRQVFAAICERWGAVPEDVIERHTPPGGVCVLYRCSDCGLEFFEPARAGDAGFYEALGQILPYERTRWEFQVTLARLPPHATVVDLGCGDGFFLRALAGRVVRSVGVDHNTAAINAARDAGFEAHDVPFATFAADNPASFDFVTAFHLVEHVTDVDAVMRPARQLLRSGGTLIVSMPNRHRATPGNFEPLDCPPHHLSRWSVEQLPELGRHSGLNLVDVTFEPLREHWWGTILLVRELLPGLPFRFQRLIAALIRRTWLTPARHERLIEQGWFESRGLYGHTMLAEYARRD